MKNLSDESLNTGAVVGPQGEGLSNPTAFPAYPAYKDSGVEWLRVVPGHWGVSPLKWLAEQITAKATISDFQVGLENIEGWTGRFIQTDSEFAGEGIQFRQGDILFGKLRPYLAKVWLAGKSGQAVGDFFVIRPCAIDGEFLRKYILTSAVIENLNASTIGAKMPRVGWEDMSATPVTLPPYKEQVQIARFLDHETARIDALIEEQQRLIELLKEKRQAMISHAVTKGLDPKVPMKHSGVEWLGEVPAQWIVRKLKNLVSVRGGSTPSKEVERYWEGDIPWVSPKDMKSERISDSIDHVSDSAIKDGGLNMVKGGAILIVVRGMILIHSVPVAITDVDVTINQDMKAMTPCAELSSDYLSLLLQGVRDAVFQYIDSSAHGTRKLEWERFELINLPVPSHSEQNSIVSSIEMHKRAIDDLTEQAASAITLMKERRSALISAAVIGKIDVRGWQPSASVPILELVKEAV